MKLFFDHRPPLNKSNNKYNLYYFENTQTFSTTSFVI